MALLVAPAATVHTSWRVSFHSNPEVHLSHPPASSPSPALQATEVLLSISCVVLRMILSGSRFLLTPPFCHTASASPWVWVDPPRPHLPPAVLHVADTRTEIEALLLALPHLLSFYTLVCRDSGFTRQTFVFPVTSETWYMLTCYHGGP